jgi:hypothetical protein
MSAALRTTHYCFLPTRHAVNDNDERESVFQRNRLTAFKAHCAALKSTAGDNLLQRSVVKKDWSQKYYFIEMVVDDDSPMHCKICDKNFSISTEERTTSRGMLLAPFIKRMLYGKIPIN